MIVRPLQPGEAPRWDAVARQLPGATFYTQHAFRSVIRRTYGHATHYLVAEEAGAIHGLLPLFEVRSRLLGHYLSSMPGGPVARSRGAMDALVARACTLADELRVDHLVLREGLAPWADDLPSDREHHCTVVVPVVAGDPQAQWAALSGKARRAVRQARKAGLVAHLAGPAGAAAFHRVFAENMRDLGTPVIPLRLVQNLLAEPALRTRLVLVERRGETVGAMLLQRFGEGVHNPWVSSSRRHFDARPNDLLYWEALRWAAGEGLTTLDLGRSQWGSGTHRFKMKWGGEPRPLVYQYYLRRGGGIPDLAQKVEGDPLYRLARRTWQRLPLPVANRLGPPIVRRINPLG